MNQGQTVFAQLLNHVPQHLFERCVGKYAGDHRIRSFSCWTQFLCMAFAQLTYRESLRDIELCLRTAGKKLYHMGIRGPVSRNTLASANAQRDWRIYEAFAQELIRAARPLYAHDTFCGDLDEMVYALDSTTIDLCLSLFPWADFRRTKAAVKVHTLLDLHGNIPSFIQITSGKVHDVRILDQMPLEPGAIYIMDRGYLDFKRLYRFQQHAAFFVTRAKANTACHRLYSRPTDRSTGVICDQTIRLDGWRTASYYPDHLRRIRFFDVETQRRLIFLTNNFVLPPLTIALLYKCRWQVELFFKWIKQHLRIKSFFGTSENAVKTQIWIAIATYVLVAVMKKRLNLELSLYTILQFFSVHCFEKIHILEALTKYDANDYGDTPCNQLKLFDF
jgi:hypothetical protein